LRLSKILKRRQVKPMPKRKRRRNEKIKTRGMQKRLTMRSKKLKNQKNPPQEEIQL